MTLEAVFDRRNNALNALRLVFAISVILVHSFTVTGRDVPFGRAAQLLGCVGVDGFFALSGFLITASWLRNPELRGYLAARALRILPGLYVCLILTAFVIAPIGLAIQGGSGWKLLFSTAPFEYVLANSGVMVLKGDVGGTPDGVPYPGIWNPSLWTLIFELVCYLVVAALGVAGLAHRRWISPAALVLALCAALLFPPVATEAILDGTAGVGIQIVSSMARFAMMFAAGAMLYHFRDVIPARWSLVVVSVGIVLAAGCFLPDYRVVAAVPLAYAAIVSGALVRNKCLSLQTDLSYGTYIYGFPMQQLLVICGLAFLNSYVFAAVATIATLPLAALSWFLVEKHAISLKSRVLRKRSAPGPEGGADPDGISSDAHRQQSPPARETLDDDSAHAS